MKVLRHPGTCDVCCGKLAGSAEITLEREGDKYFINVSQTTPLDWSICRKCKRVACLASCWNKRMNECKACASANKTENCPGCGRALIGAIEVVETEMFGIPTILLEETPDRNWIECDACSLVVCKGCCQNPKSGFCNRCLALWEQDRKAKPPRPVVITVESHRFNQGDGSQSTETKTPIQTNQGGQTK